MTAETVAAAAAVPRATQSARPRRRRWRRFTIGLVALLAGGEVVARLWDLGAGGTGSLYDSIRPAGSRFKMKPGIRVQVPERYGLIGYSFNSDGYRDGEHAVVAARPRVVLLGDSVTFGLGVQQDEIYAAVLQRELDARHGGGFEVCNLAIFAYHSGNELEALREDGLALAPAVVVLQFYMNDLSQPTAAEGRADAVPAGAPTLGQRLTALKNRYAYRSAFYRRGHQAAARTAYLLLHDLRRTRFPHTLNDDEPRHKTDFLRARPDDAGIPAFASVLAMRDAATAAGARFLVLLTPDETQLFTRRFDSINERVALFCRRNGIDLVDVLPVLRAAPRPEALYLDGVHLTAAGHQIVGRRLAQAIAS